MVSEAGAMTLPTIDVALRDPFARVLALGARDRSRLARSLVATLLMYAGGAIAGFATSTDLHAFAADVLRAVVRARSVLEIELEPPKPPPPEPPPEEKPPEPEAPPKEAPPPPAAPPPAPAQAGKVLTADPDPDEPVDLTGNTFVQGTADTFAGGVTSSTGTSKSAVKGITSATGVPDAPPVKAVAVAATGPDRSRQATPASGSWNDCGFPAEADIEQINNARVTLQVTVGADGQAQDAKVLLDPGFGFGALARRCALRKAYNPALDRSGTAIKDTQVVKMNFVR